MEHMNNNRSNLSYAEIRRIAVMCGIHETNDDVQPVLCELLSRTRKRKKGKPKKPRNSIIATTGNFFLPQENYVDARHIIHAPDSTPTVVVVHSVSDGQMESVQQAYGKFKTNSIEEGDTQKPDTEFAMFFHRDHDDKSFWTHVDTNCQYRTLLSVQYMTPLCDGEGYLLHVREEHNKPVVRVLFCKTPLDTLLQNHWTVATHAKFPRRFRDIVLMFLAVNYHCDDNVQLPWDLLQVVLWHL
eukprot:TRINITY_DN61599_c0_g1_i1.p1 TRINITY_DN61599_c0_g1~~TRINITY_DN61599_c0_g1_i1.p1  ORF type:complete len:271 (-),score=9.49 TRINITY_DN61599_c0_g1_i1:110-835(-)